MVFAKIDGLSKRIELLEMQQENNTELQNIGDSVFKSRETLDDTLIFTGPSKRVLDDDESSVADSHAVGSFTSNRAQRNFTLHT